MAGFHDVVAYAPPGATALGLGIASGVFGPPPGRTGFAFAICADRPGHLVTDLGLPLDASHGPERLATADLVLVLPGAGFRTPPAHGVVTALRAAHDRGALVAAHCTGVFVLAATGLLDGRTATTHWQFADELRERHPAIRVRAGELYVDEGTLVTGAGAAAGLDLCLHLVRREHGAARANEIGRGLVTPPHRDGGQRQYVVAGTAAGRDDAHLAGVIAYAREHLDHRLTIDVLAARALMSRRSFVRHFQAVTGATPHAWLRTQRLNLAEELLETTDLGLEQVAARVGYANAATLREQFVRRRGVAPRDYRRTFAGVRAPS